MAIEISGAVRYQATNTELAVWEFDADHTSQNDLGQSKAGWLGRWISCDPLGKLSKINLYDFTSNNPINRKDDLGLKDKSSSNGKSGEANIVYKKETEIIFTAEEVPEAVIDVDLNAEPQKPGPQAAKSDWEYYYKRRGESFRKKNLQGIKEKSKPLLVIGAPNLAVAGFALAAPLVVSTFSAVTALAATYPKTAMAIGAGLIVTDLSVNYESCEEANITGVVTAAAATAAVSAVSKVRMSAALAQDTKIPIEKIITWGEHQARLLYTGPVETTEEAVGRAVSMQKWTNEIANQVNLRAEYLRNYKLGSGGGAAFPQEELVILDATAWSKPIDIYSSGVGRQVTADEVAKMIFAHEARHVAGITSSEIEATRIAIELYKHDPTTVALLIFHLKMLGGGFRH